jgi:hypothetical protein
MCGLTLSVWFLLFENATHLSSCFILYTKSFKFWCYDLAPYNIFTWNIVDLQIARNAFKLGE